MEKYQTSHAQKENKLSNSNINLVVTCACYDPKSKVTNERVLLNQFTENSGR